MDGEKGYHFFATLDWRNWTVTAAFAGDSMIQPISWGPTIFNDRGTRNDDERNFIDAAYERQIAGGTLRWRTYYDSFHYEGRGDYALSDGGVEDNRQTRSAIGSGPSSPTASVLSSPETSPWAWRAKLICEPS